MLFLVQMDVRIPHDADPDVVARLTAAEKECSQNLQRAGEWRHLWRVVGRHANVSVFDVDSNDRLHELLARLPLYTFMEITVTPLATHPSAV